MRARILGLVATMLVGGCYRPDVAPGAPCSANGSCPSPLECRNGTCEVAGTGGDAAPDVMVDACPENACLGTDLAGCGSRITCSLGCAPAAGPDPAHCMVMVPSNGITTGLLAGATANIVGLDWDFDTDTGQVLEGTTVVRPAGTGVIAGIGFTRIDQMGVFTAHSFEVGPYVNSADDWDPHGTNALVLFAATTINVVGRIDAGGTGQGAGPGGGDGAGSGSTGPTCRGKAGLWQAANFGEGGGGGGGRTAGANGAPSNLATFGAGGASCSTPDTIPLRGGNGGGAGGVEVATNPDTVHGGVGGGGGGAMALVAMESITITGQVTSPGAGGSTSANGDGGGGGGGGGAIFVEAPVVTVGGAVTANGGAGAAPSVADGERGRITSGSQAAGGSYMSTSGGKGGTGSASPTAGATYSDGLGTMARGGGGGGAAGRTEIKSRSRSTTGATLSPSPSFSDIMVR